MNKVCQYCGDILKGRADKKFCNDHCRNYYNNTKLHNDVNPVQIEIKIQDKPIKQIRSFKLDQAIFDHHQFEILCPVNSNLSTFNLFDILIGLPIQIKLTSKEGYNLSFIGIIAEIQLSLLNGSSGDITIRGTSPTILLDGVPNCRSWERKVLKSIVSDVLKSFPSEMLQTKINSGYLETLSYVVQYNETAWLFLKRLATNYGEWLYYNGQQLAFGLPQEEKLNVEYGTNLNRFEIFEQCLPTTFHLLAYDNINHQVHDVKSKPGDIDIALSDHKLLVERSELLYSTLPKQWHNGHVTNVKQLHDLIALKRAGQISDMVKYYGSSTLTAIQPGSMIQVAYKGEHFGEYIIISVKHECNEYGYCNNEFVAVPASVKVPPIQPIVEPRCETQNARIIDNEDGKGLGRVRVRFHWMTEDEKSPWLPVVHPQTLSNQNGLFTALNIGQDVMVAFQGDHPQRPFILGVLCRGNGNHNVVNKDNTVNSKNTA